jgi:hypothetical protein
VRETLIPDHQRGTTMNGDGTEGSEIIEVTPGWGVRLAQASTIEIRAAIYFKEAKWQYSESDGPLVLYAIDCLWNGCGGHFPSVAAMKEALAAKDGTISEPVIEVGRGHFVELRKATGDDLRAALEEIANPVRDEQLGPLWRFMRTAFADNVVGQAKITAALAELSSEERHRLVESTLVTESPPTTLSGRDRRH